MTNKILEWIINWFNKHTKLNKDMIISHTTESYFEQGWIDSLQFITFISDIENEYAIHFSNDDFQNRKFSTVKGLTEIIEERLNG